MMAESILDVMRDNLNAASVSNALYELMVEWFTAATLQVAGPTQSAIKKWGKKRSWIERTLAKFFNVSDHEMRDLLEEHYGVKIPVKMR
jgi:hypothetical protein